MVDLSKVYGPDGKPTEGPKKKKEHEIDPEKFREMMGKVGEAGPEEQGKRKRKDEQEADLEGQFLASGMPGQGEITPVSDEDTFKLTLGDELPRGGFGASAPSGEGVSTPSEQQPPTEYPQAYESQTAQPEPKHHKQRAQKEIEPAQQQRTPSKTTKKKPEKLTEGLPTPKGVKKPETEKKPPITPLIPPEKKPSVPPKLTEKEKEKEVAEEMEIAAPLPSGAWEQKVEKVKEKEKEPLVTYGLAKEDLPTFLGSPGMPIAVLPSEASSPYFKVPEIYEMFERMVGVMTVMTTTGMSQTTLVLDAPQFASSPFFGVEIEITEFSTAPKAFNIEIRAPDIAKNIIDKNVSELVAAFQAGQYNYRVNRVDTALLPISRAERLKVQKPKGRSQT